ncbi:MAG: acyl-[acyl-carrier-protein] thioesterase [Lachnospiraceae bacterium]|jgi:medium-chain acyl-[acyl-carrier-protein] hydrolase
MNSHTDIKAAGGIFSRELTIRASDTDMYRQLRMSRLFSMIQEISIAHTEALGCPRQTTLDRGLLWVITRLHLRLARPILYDEKLRLESWPEPMIHMVYPRGYRITDASGIIIGECSALWTIIDAASRAIALPSRTGVIIPGIHREGELPLPQGLAYPSGGNTSEHKVLYSEIDLNGHVNNTCYFDWIDDLFEPSAHRGGLYREIQMNFQREITPDATVTLHWKTESGENIAAAGARILRVCGTFSGAAAFTAEAELRQ